MVELPILGTMAECMIFTATNQKITIAIKVRWLVSTYVMTDLCNDLCNVKKGLGHNYLVTLGNEECKVFCFISFF